MILNGLGDSGEGASFDFQLHDRCDIIPNLIVVNFWCVAVDHTRFFQFGKMVRYCGDGNIHLFGETTKACSSIIEEAVHQFGIEIVVCHCVPGANQSTICFRNADLARGFFDECVRKSVER
ncbi:hypothetical protein EL22_28270 [Halostagnicola sp. A56]|nr:hypothetical protein EL22_28270 [Halostagnicola sp. A56]